MLALTILATVATLGTAAAPDPLVQAHRLPTATIAPAGPAWTRLRVLAGGGAAICAVEPEAFAGDRASPLAPQSGAICQAAAEGPVATDPKPAVIRASGKFASAAGAAHAAARLFSEAFVGPKSSLSKPKSDAALTNGTTLTCKASCTTQSQATIVKQETRRSSAV